MSVDHYENFPVASLLLPRRLREPVKNIYRFARSADDIADEGDATPTERLQALQDYQLALQHIAAGKPACQSDDTRLVQVFNPLQDSIAKFDLPIQPFEDLLSAFAQDVVKTRYDSATELLDYSRRSANPVGRLMLHLYKAYDDTNVAQSDAICTGLQLTNFWQDVAIDWRKNRIYIPQIAMLRHGIDEQYISQRHDVAASSSAGILRNRQQDAGWQALMREQVEWARRLLKVGYPLTQRLPGRVGFELRLVVLGGLRILERLDTLHYNMFEHRPTMKMPDWMRIFIRALRSHPSS